LFTHSKGAKVAIVIALGVIVVFIGAALIMSKLTESRRLRRIKLEDQARIDAEVARIAALPKLDTSRMLQVKLTDDAIRASKKHGGVFGSRYVHMLVVDRDGRQYHCFMTRFNIEALWRSGFVQANISPLLVEREENFMIDGVEIGPYPASLRSFEHSALVWKAWAKLHKEFDEMGENHFSVLGSFYDLGRPRDVPVHRATA
jgi:hypothetical protein